MKLIVGLGNPGSEYAGTRHNIGFRAVERVAANLRAFEQGRIWQGTVARTSFAGEKIYLLKPLTFMNNSGRSVAAAIKELNPDEDDVLIVFDDLALPLGTLRFRIRGSAGGQKGMQSILQALGHQEVSRLRLGIGADSPLIPRDFVLHPFAKDELPLVEKMLEEAAHAIELWIHQGIVPAMNKYNGPVEL